MSLYLKYRPKTIDELDLEVVRQTLQSIVKATALAHAYLLTGPRGAGKTSTARVLARMANCQKQKDDSLGEPCNKCAACLAIMDGSAVDVIEIDAASNRGIDDIRELKDKIRLSPAYLRRKVYIIDEVHMLTNEAFNALLKTLEEPPKHVMFVLCTTELHKVPETIISRCVQIKFTKATSEEMKRSLARVVAGEGKEVTEEALEYLAKAVDGSFRDGVKVLDLVLAGEKQVGIAEVQQVIAGVAGYEVKPLLDALTQKQTASALKCLQQATAGGVDLSYLLVTVMRGLRDRLLAGEVEVEVTKLIFSLDEVARRLATALDGELLIQTAIVEWGGVPQADTQQTPNSDNSKNPSKKAGAGSEEKLAIPVKQVAVDGAAVWGKLMGSLNGDSMTLGALLAKAGPAKIQGDVLTIAVRYDFHRQQLMTEKTLHKLEGLVSEVMGRPMRVRCEVQATETVSQGSADTQADDIIEEAKAIFN